MPEREEYLDKFQELQKTYSNPSKPHQAVDQNEANCMEFASANLRHLLPEIPVSRHVEIINEILFNQARADLDEDSCFLFDHIELCDPGGVLEAAQQHPTIFCTFHFGSYRLINQAICRQGLNYILPVNTEVYTNQGQRYEVNISVLKAYFGSATQLLVVNAEEPTAALTMARKTRAGYSLLAYIDGNTGVQGAGRRDTKTIRVPLLGRPIFARKGIAFLSHFLKLPIVPVVCEVTGDLQYNMTFHEQIKPNSATETREDYCQRATGQLYAVLGDYLKKSPGQWEGWLDMQKYLDLDGMEEDQDSVESEADMELQAEDVAGRTLVFNQARYGFVVQEEGSALLDKNSYKLLSLPEDITGILSCYREPATVSADMTAEQTDILAQLVSMEMLSLVDQSPD